MEETSPTHVRDKCTLCTGNNIPILLEVLMSSIYFPRQHKTNFNINQNHEVSLTTMTSLPVILSPILHINMVTHMYNQR